jgi:hypothetical protein
LKIFKLEPMNVFLGGLVTGIIGIVTVLIYALVSRFGLATVLAGLFISFISSLIIGAFIEIGTTAGDRINDK